MAPALHARGYDGDRLEAAVGRLLTANPLCSMATRSEAGGVHISTAFFAFGEELILFFLSHPESVHSHNLRSVPQMAVAVFDSHQPWGAPHAGLQLVGRGTVTPDDAVRPARELYAARFPRYGELFERAATGTPVGPTFGALRFYSFVPERIQILDEWEFGEEAFITATIVR